MTEQTPQTETPESESQAFTQLKNKLEEIFQMNRADLDFGIYRIMNRKREEISQFLKNDLLPQVRGVLRGYHETSRTAAEDALKRTLNGLTLEKDHDKFSELQKQAQQLQAEIAAAVDIDELESEVYSDLYNFFKRYYSEGDFLSLRRYKAGVYALPYEGEEVKLHWANHDQYYIKTSETLKNYSFKTPNGKRVRFEVVAGSTEMNNNKAANGNERRFVLCTDQPITATEDELVVRFEYRQLTDEEKIKPVTNGNGETKNGKKKQEDLNREAAQSLLSMGEVSPFGLGAKCPTENNEERTVLEKHLTAYTAKNTFDYFIHKDLAGFLKRELDFYIKNEIVHLDDIENQTVKDIQAYLHKVKALRGVAVKVIGFLAQLENFQKKLWLKKKFVLETHYCVTLDKIINSEAADELLPIIAANEQQREEWVNLFAINEINGDLANAAAYSAPLSVDFLKAHDKLPVDTKFFDADFKFRLLTIFGNLDEQTDGVLINSENFQALNLIQARYAEQVKCVYIDPPFNLGENGDFLYKTDYKDSTWTSLLDNRLTIGKALLSDDGMNFIRCDNNGNYLVRSIADSIFGKEGFQSELLVQRIRKNVTSQGKISMPLANDSLFLYFNSSKCSLVNPHLTLEKTRDSYWRRIDDSAGHRNPHERTIFGKVFEPYKYDAHFKYSQQSIDKMVGEGKIRLLCKACGYIHTDGVWDKCPSCRNKEATPQYKVASSDTKILDTNWMDISGYSSKWGFSTENSEALLERVLAVSTSEGDLVLDYFLGSGTTAAVAFKNNRRWIGIEVGKHFYDIPLCRMKKLSHESSKQEVVFKYIALEQYEDTMDNLVLGQSDMQKDLLARHSSFNEGYLLSYLLDTQSHASQSLLNIDGFANPFNYTLRITRSDDTQEVKVDMVETFNYLLGLTIHTITRNELGMVVVVGINCMNEKCLIVWRSVAAVDNEQLNKWFEDNHAHYQFDVVYVNGDNTLASLKADNEQWEMRRIDVEFKRLMFDVQDM